MATLICLLLGHRPDVRLVTSTVGRWEPKRFCRRCYRELRLPW